MKDRTLSPQIQYPSSEPWIDYLEGIPAIFGEKQEWKLRKKRTKGGKEPVVSSYESILKNIEDLEKSEKKISTFSFLLRIITSTLLELESEKRFLDISNQKISEMLLKEDKLKTPSPPKTANAVKVEEGVEGIKDKIRIKVDLNKLKPNLIHLFRYKDREVGVQILPEGKIKFFEVIKE